MGFGWVVIFESSERFSTYVENMIWPALLCASIFSFGIAVFERCKDDERENANVNADAGNGDGDGDGSEVVVEQELERRLEEMEVDLEKGVGETEGNSEGGRELVGVVEPLKWKGKEKEADIENQKR